MRASCLVELLLSHIGKYHENLTVVQEKQFGSLSQNAGNKGASIRLRLINGRKHEFSVDMFREDGHIIHGRISDATNMVPRTKGS